VMPSQACAAESFCDLLLEPEREWRSLLPSADLVEQITEQDANIQLARCLTVGSLKLEPGLAPRWLRRGIAIVDMECSAFFAAADHVRLRAAALFFATDVVQGRPFYAPMEPQIESRIAEAKSRGCAILQRWART
jgi:purine-nucleoside phosphorylase